MALKKIPAISAGKPFKTAKLPTAKATIHVTSQKPSKTAKLKTHETGHL